MAHRLCGAAWRCGFNSLHFAIVHRAIYGTGRPLTGVHGCAGQCGSRLSGRNRIC